MKANLWKHSLALFGLTAGLLAGLPALGNPLQRADVAADAIWVAHVDFDALRASTLGQYVMSQLDTPDVRARFAGFEQLFGFDLRTELRGVTLYSTGTAPEDGLLLFYADFNPERLAALANAAAEAANTPYKKHVIYSWVDENEPPVGNELPRVYAAIQSNLVVFGQREVRVARALDVFDGATTNLASTQSFAPLGAVGDTNFVEAAAIKLSLPDAAAQAAVLKLVKGARFQLGESQGNVSAKLTIDATDEEVAGRMRSVAQGVVAALELVQDKPQVHQLAKGFTLKLEGPTLGVVVAYPVTNLVDLLKAQLDAKTAQTSQAESGK